MHSDQGSYIILPGKSGTDLLVLISCNRYTIGTSAKKDAKSRFSTFNTAGSRVRKIRIVNRIE
ncbi:hypothetical protein D3C86_2147480 [compost metagenome]